VIAARVVAQVARMRLARGLLQVHAMHGTNAWTLVEPIVALGIARRMRPTPRVPIGRVFDLWEQAARATRDPTLPIAIGRRVRLEALDLMGLAVITAPTGHAALAAAIRFAPLITDSGRWSLVDDGAAITIRWSREGERTLGHRLANEAGIAQFVACMRQLCGPRFVPRVVRFRHAGPPSLAAHRAYFRCPVEVGTDDDAFEFPREALDVVPAAANPALAAFVRMHAEARLATFGDVVSRTRDAIGRALDRGERPGLDEIAVAQATSTRTLRRRLASGGTSFAVLLDDAIRDRACTLVTQTTRSITSIALTLGFSDSSAFTHAYRRWFDRAPVAVRRSPTARSA
jgi:AraC-like DNA-binding protein